MLTLFLGGFTAEYFIKNNSSVVNNIRVCVDVLSLFMMYLFVCFTFFKL